MNKQVKWFYHGPDNKVHGPYHAKDMLMWTQTGYFKDNLLIRTEHEEGFRTLGEWTRLASGKLPFLLPVLSMDHMLASLSLNNQQSAPMMMVPPGLAPPFPPPLSRYHNGAFMNLPPNAVPSSQPPSEPIDAGSLCHTPDSDQEINHADVLHGGVLRNAAVMTAPQTKSVACGTETMMKNAECQTTPIILNGKDAARILSEMLGQKVLVT
ncbi:unnamed protein product [Auanema sp. JU1783]|nr:unnamed protein product [Auanema sp. JU1783]